MQLIPMVLLLVVLELFNLLLENGQAQMPLLLIKRKKLIVWFVLMTLLVTPSLILLALNLTLMLMPKVKILSIGNSTNLVQPNKLL